jgi:hypothetical protein
MILRLKGCIALLAETDDARRIGVVAFNANHDCLWSREDAHARNTAWWRAFRRISLQEIAGHIGRQPGGLVEESIDDNGGG